MGKKDIDNGIQRWFLAAMEHYGSHLKVCGGSTESPADSTVNTAFPWTKLTFHNL